MNSSNIRVEGITIAITNEDEMVKFYQNVFNIEFKQEDAFGSTLYHGSVSSFNILLCPNKIANVNAEKNRIQFDLVVTDLNETIKVVTANGGSLLEEPKQHEQEVFGSVVDPDGNTIVLKQYL
ncbi:VOC family protein [Ekhidna sp.]|uniref:VOC family protein n=1 Tax=Ekhidna sp. TaxID=2608089 RepID=UPI003CCBB426